MDILLDGFLSILTFPAILLIAVGVFIGLIFGSIPGLTATMAIALCLPITFGMEPTNGMVFLMGLYIGGVSGGLIPAALLNIPGTPASIATTFDAYPMMKNGEEKRALGFGVIASFIGSIISIFLLFIIAPSLATIAVKFGPYEYFAVSIFALTMISSFSQSSMIKGLLSAGLGVTFALVGSAPIDAYPRFTFGFTELNSGFSLLTVLIGVFGISEILKASVSSKGSEKKKTLENNSRGFGVKLSEIFKHKWNLVRSSLIGMGIGILPGIGGSTSNLIAYAAAKNQSKYPEKFGTGIPDGIVASESANNASIGGALVPLFVLGIPGDASTAILLGGLIIHGLSPGPQLFITNGPLVYGIFISLLIASSFMLLFYYFGIRFFVKVLSIPKHYLYPIILILCFVGAYGVNNRMFDVWALLFFGIVGYLLLEFKFPLPHLILGFILGPIIETNLRRGLMQSQGDFAPFVTEPIAGMFLLIALVVVLLPFIKKKKTLKGSSL